MQKPEPASHLGPVSPEAKSWPGALSVSRFAGTRSSERMTGVVGVAQTETPH